jgi:hypothetical protein
MSALSSSVCYSAAAILRNVNQPVEITMQTNFIVIFWVLFMGSIVLSSVANAEYTGGGFFGEQQYGGK